MTSKARLFNKSYGKIVKPDTRTFRGQGKKWFIWLPKVMLWSWCQHDLVVFKLWINLLPCTAYNASRKSRYSSKHNLTWRVLDINVMVLHNYVHEHCIGPIAKVCATLPPSEIQFWNVQCARHESRVYVLLNSGRHMYDRNVFKPEYYL